jgi:hypothetical protein
MTEFLFFQKANRIHLICDLYKVEDYFEDTK